MVNSSHTRRPGGSRQESSLKGWITAVSVNRLTRHRPAHETRHDMFEACVSKNGKTLGAIQAAVAVPGEGGSFVGSRVPVETTAHATQHTETMLGGCHRRRWRCLMRAAP